MTPDETNSFIGAIEAATGWAIPPRARPHYAQFCSGVTLDICRRALAYLEAKAGGGFDQKNAPNLSQIKQTVRLLGDRDRTRMRGSNDDRPTQVNCPHCSGGGWVFVVKGGPTADRARVRTHTETANWPVMFVSPHACTCPAGEVTNECYGRYGQGLAKHIRAWSIEHCAYRYWADAKAFIRKCRGLPPPEPAEDGALNDAALNDAATTMTTDEPEDIPSWI